MTAATAVAERSPGDAGLMQQVADGSLDAFEELYGRYSNRAYRVAWSICQEVGLAEDAVQESFLAVWQKRDSFQPALGSVAAWLLSVVRHRAIDVLRRHGQHSARRADEDALQDHRSPGGPTEDLLAHSHAANMGTLLRALPDLQREVIVLAFYGQLTHTEIAAHLKLPPGTVKGRMRLGLHKLRDDIDERALA